MYRQIRHKHMHTDPNPRHHRSSTIKGSLDILVDDHITLILNENQRSHKITGLPDHVSQRREAPLPKGGRVIGSVEKKT